MKQFDYCPIRPGIICEEKGKKCTACGWHPSVEAKRKETISTLIKLGQFNGKIRV